ncbi:sodium-dependent transporter [Peptoniphilus sp.]|uniref:sodium-dependent transporter n=1 Tax=Peptoniphilus sp. TaxID=1971214 RepID=UPI003992534F
MTDNNKKRDSFRSQWGFILACIGSAVGMGNIWMFPIRVHKFGGFTFLIPYIFFVIVIGYSGIVEEMALGRGLKAGPRGAFLKATESRGSQAGKYIGLIPVIGSFAIAIGYTVVVGWIIRFLVGSMTGSLIAAEDSGAYFGSIAGPYGSVVWHAVAIILCMVIMSYGIGAGIEKVNKFMMPAFFLFFIILAIKVVLLPGSKEGYRFLFSPDFSELKDPQIWIYGLGQAFFSLSLAGSGTVVYGSYLSDEDNILYSAKWTAIFDTIAAMLAAMVIIPAIYAFQVEAAGGPPLMFIIMPTIFKSMVGGRIFAVIFFIAVLFAGVTSLINLYETPVEMLEERYGLGRKTATIIILALGFIIGIAIENGDVLGAWMDAVSIYVIPLGALLAAIIFAWVLDKEFATKEIFKGSGKVGENELIYTWIKYVYVGISLAVYLIGIFWGAIG